MNNKEFSLIISLSFYDNHMKVKDFLKNKPIFPALSNKNLC